MSGVSLAHFLGAPVPPPSREVMTEMPMVDWRAWWPEEIQHLSNTSIGMFRRCPEQFRHRYLLHEKERPGESLVIGSMFHGALEHNYGQKLETHTDLPTAEVTQYLQDVAVPAVLEENGGADGIAWDAATPEKGVEVARRDSERMLIRYHEDVVPRLQPITLEEQFYLDDPSLIVPLMGYIDLKVGYELEEVGWVADRVLDTKTGKQSNSKLKPSWMLQGELYSAATGLPTEFHSISRAASPKITTALQSPDLVVSPDPVKAANVISSAAQIAKMIAWLYHTLGPYETWPTMGRFADFTMSFSPCERCGWRSVCPAMKGEV